MPHFTFNKNQRNGIFFLLLLIVIFQCIYFFAVPIFIGISSSESKIINDKNFIAFQKQIDSLKHIELKNKKFKVLPFNPNYLDDYKGYSFGMSSKQIDKLFEYRKNGKFINSSLEFQIITGVSDSLLNLMTPYFKFPDWINEKKVTNNSKSVNKTFEGRLISSSNLNLATIQDLKTVSGIGDILSERIIKYRDRLKGFTFNDQLYEVYGLEKNIADIVLEKFPIKTIPEIKKININDASLKELNSIIYINYNQAKSIVEYRSKVGEIHNIDELLKIEGFTIEKINRIGLYLTIE